MKNVEQIINKYIDALASDESRTGGIKYILVYITHDKLFHHSIGNDFCSLIDEYDENQLTTEKALIKQLKKNNAVIGAIYERKTTHFKLIRKKGF